MFMIHKKFSRSSSDGLQCTIQSIRIWRGQKRFVTCFHKYRRNIKISSWFLIFFNFLIFWLLWYHCCRNCNINVQLTNDQPLLFWQNFTFCNCCKILEFCFLLQIQWFLFFFGKFAIFWGKEYLNAF